MSQQTMVERARESVDPVRDGNTATVTARGPTMLRGDLVLIGENHAAALHETRLTLCRCGGSANKPYCDGTHVKIGFMS
jgi:CDGSH-type Zn-finger protein